MRSDSQVIYLSPLAIHSTPAIEVVTLIENYVSRDESGATAAPSPACKRQIDFVEEPSIPKDPQLPMQEEL